MAIYDGEKETMEEGERWKMSEEATASEIQEENCRNKMERLGDQCENDTFFL